MKKFIKSNQIIVINIAFLIGGLFLGWFGYDYYWEYKFLSLEEESATSLELEVDYSFLEEEPSGSMLRVIEPYDCYASSSLSDSDSCYNLTDGGYTGWRDAGNSCLDETLTFYFDKTYFIEFIVISNFEKESEFKEVDKINDFRLTFPYGENESVEETHYLVNDNFEQWKDINKVVDEMTIEIISYYDTPGTNICGLQEITFFGKDIDG